MNSSQFTDKQIMQSNDFFELLNPPDEQKSADKKEDVLPSYDFMPIRPAGASQSMNLEGNNVGGTRVWSSADSWANASNPKNYVSSYPSEPAKISVEKDRSDCDTAIVSEIDRTMKKHADNLLQVLEGVSARLSQLESRSHHLENSVDDLKLSVGNNHGSTDGKLRQLENILREVQISVQVVRDKQEIAEAQLQLMKLQVSSAEHQPQNQNATVHTDSVQQVASAPQPSHQPLPPVAALQQPTQPFPPVASLQQPVQPFPALHPNAPPPPPPSHQTPPTQLPQNPSNQLQEPSFPPPGQTHEAIHQQYQLPSTQQSQPAPQHYQPTPQLPQYSQPPQHPQHLPPMGPSHPPQFPPPLSHHTEEASYMPSQSYPPSIRQSPSMTQPPAGAPSPQQYYGGPSSAYEPPSSKPSSGFSQGYGQTSVPNYNDSYSYSGSPSHYGSSMLKPSQHSSSFSAPSGGSNYPRLPTAQILPHALPTATSDGGSSSSGSAGNRLPVDDVVEKVSMMGFSRDQVRATVRKLTENGQSVDLNVVLDTLMNGGGEVQPQKGWFGR